MGFVGGFCYKTEDRALKRNITTRGPPVNTKPLRATYYLTFRMTAFGQNRKLCSHEGRTLETNSLQPLACIPDLTGDTVLKGY